MQTSHKDEIVTENRPKSVSNWALKTTALALLGCTFSLVLYESLDRYENSLEAFRFNLLAEERGLAIENEFLLMAEDTRAIQALFDSSQQVDRHEFSVFCRSLMTRRSATISLQWLPRILQDQRDAHEKLTRESGVAGYQITDLRRDGEFHRAAPRAEYFPIYFVEPEVGADQALGFDHYASVEARRQAMERARDSAQAKIASLVPLAINMEEKYGLLIYRAVYGHDMPTNTVEERRKALRGFVVGVYGIGRVVENALNNLGDLGMAVEIHDITEPGQDILLYKRTAVSEESNEIVVHTGRSRTHSEEFNIGSYRWAVICRSTPDYLARQPRGWTPLIGMIAGLSVTCVLLLWNWTLVKQTETVERLVHARTLELNASEIKARTIVESASDAIIGVDEEGRIVLWNAQAETVFGWKHREAMGRLFFNTVIAPRCTEALRAELDRSRSTEISKLQGRLVETTAVRKEGTEFPASVTFSPLAGIEGLAWIAILRDVTDRVLAEEKLKHALGSAESATRAKSSFLANMSHEIRTPMNGIIGALDLLMETPLNHEQKDLARTSMSSAESLLRLLNDILDYSKVEAGKLNLELIDFHLYHVMESVVALVTPQVGDKKVEVAMDVDGDVPHRLHGDPERLKQILINLLSNAVKFTPEGEVVLSVHKQSETLLEVVLKFSVRDTGVGITRGAADMLFQPFVQADNSTTRRFGGTGLGLAICKQLVDLMGGQIGVESEPGKGSTFWFVVPLRKQSVPGGQDIESTRDFAATHLHNLRVLIVDDNVTNRRIFSKQAMNWRMTPLLAEHAKQALQLLSQEHEAGRGVDVILTDFQMPDIDGLTLSQMIHRDARFAQIPIIVLTSIMHRLNPSDLDAAGIRACLYKPVRQSLLMDTLMSVLDTSKLRGLPAAEIAAAPQTAEPSGQGYRLLLVEDNPTNEKVVTRLLQKMGYEVRAVNNGRLAVEATAGEPFDAVLMDCQMPEMDGYEATGAIRHREAGAGYRLPIIAMTANAMQGDREKCLAAGMDDYISKPVNRAELSGVLQEWVTKAKPPRAEKSNPASIQTGAPMIDRKQLLEITDGDESLAWEFMDLYLKQTGPQLQELIRAAAGGDAGQTMHLAHAAKGASLNCGLNALGQVLKDIELRSKQGESQSLEPLAKQAAMEYEKLVKYLNELRAGGGKLCSADS